MITLNDIIYMDSTSLDDVFKLEDHELQFIINLFEQLLPELKKEQNKRRANKIFWS